MSQLAKQREKGFSTQKKPSPDPIKFRKDKRVIGKIMKLPPLNKITTLKEDRKWQTISFDRKKERKRQQDILQRSLKNTARYYNKKFMKKIVMDLIDEAISAVEKKRSFFSYKLKRKKYLKVGDFIKSRINDSNVHLAESIGPVTHRKSKIKISQVHEMDLGTKSNHES